MFTVNLKWCVEFGKCDFTDEFDWEYDLNDEQKTAYLEAIEREVPFSDYPILNAVLDEARSEIEEEQLKVLIETGDEYALECQGLAHVNPDDINDLVAERDEHALDFFGLIGCEEEEIDAWDANNLSENELPLIKDFVEGFQPYSPYDEGWIMHVRFDENQ